MFSDSMRRCVKDNFINSAMQFLPTLELNKIVSISGFLTIICEK